MKIDRSLPNPGGDGLVVVENRSTTSKVHRLTVLIDHVVVHSEDDDDNDEDGDDNEDDDDANDDDDGGGTLADRPH